MLSENSWEGNTSCQYWPFLGEW